MSTFTVKTVPTTPYEGQKPGTSGLRKRVKVFQQENYTANFIQAIFDAMPSPGPKGATLVVGGDGRYYSEDAIKIIIRLAAGNEVAKLIVGQNGILSTPATSNIIRKRQTNGGIILTASHNPGGPNHDFGIKFNSSNGGSAPEAVTNRVYEISRNINQYYEANIPEVSLASLGKQTFGNFTIEIINPVNDYVELVKELFDFDLIKNFFVKNPNYKVLVDSLHGVTGPYAIRIFVNELGLPRSSVQNDVPLPDFGGSHPDPNLVYAKSLVDRIEELDIPFGAAFDGDGDRHMIYGKGAFVVPSDSVAIIAEYASIIPYFQSTGLKGVARSMPTSRALDLVAQDKNVDLFVVPTGWKFFGNLMDAGRLSICGEESFGTGADCIREKDGIWAILAWLNIIAKVNETKPGSGIKDILRMHYEKYGRYFYLRTDYEEVESEKANRVIDHLRDLVGPSKGTFFGKTFGEFTVKDGDDFEYRDPVDGSISSHQGIRIYFTDGSRIVIRLSGTGSQGATIRVYVEKYSKNPSEYDLETLPAVQGLIDASLEISKINEYTGRTKPDVVT
ncbi:10743_t:CDS:2 [Paraglomus brasilianum]|uniref:phosphoglucomutase (alpha-D-glucose-1,6-bisphosphate-dependent) n=1 Tax=Paraglomus brasilianum TaxID=144538 RepID=A0A9N9ADB8_9GLOM|nr:10743_t:CDS:2 [Paraglomus brasilianum]